MKPIKSDEPLEGKLIQEIGTVEEKNMSVSVKTLEKAFDKIIQIYLKECSGKNATRLNEMKTYYKLLIISEIVFSLYDEIKDEEKNLELADAVKKLESDADAYIGKYYQKYYE